MTSRRKGTHRRKRKVKEKRKKRREKKEGKAEKGGHAQLGKPPQHPRQDSGHELGFLLRGLEDVTAQRHQLHKGVAQVVGSGHMPTQEAVGLQVVRFWGRGNVELGVFISGGETDEENRR